MLSQEHPMIPEVEELVLDNAQTEGEGDEVVDRILAEHEKERESPNQLNQTQDQIKHRLVVV